MKKFTAFVLAAIMVALCFSISVSAADTNLAEGKSYTIVATDDTPNIADGGKGYMWAPCVDTEPGSILTDGNVRAATALVSGGAGVKGTTLELAGTYRDGEITIDLGSAASVSSVVIRNARRGGNRYVNVAKIEVATGSSFSEVKFTETRKTVADSQQYGKEDQEAKDQFFDLTFAFTATNARYVRVTVNTDFAGNEADYNVEGARGYIAQFDEIEVYGTAAGGSTEEPSDSKADDADDSKADDSATESKPAQDSKPDTDTPDTGDAGIAVFAVLVVVSLAGVVISKKSK